MTNRRRDDLGKHNFFSNCGRFFNRLFVLCKRYSKRIQGKPSGDNEKACIGEYLSGTKEHGKCDLSEVRGINKELERGYKGTEGSDKGYSGNTHETKRAKIGENLSEQIDYIREMAWKYIKKDEGFSNEPYQDVSVLSIGYGTRANGRIWITQEQAEAEAKEYIEQGIRWYSEDFAFLHGTLRKIRGVVIICLYYNIGRKGVKNFRNMMTEISKSNWTGAAYELYNSKWFWQISKGINNPKNRAIRSVRQMAEGKE